MPNPALTGDHRHLQLDACCLFHRSGCGRVYEFRALVLGGLAPRFEQVVSAIADPRVRWINLRQHRHIAPKTRVSIRRAVPIIAYLGHLDCG